MFVGASYHVGAAGRTKSAIAVGRCLEHPTVERDRISPFPQERLDEALGLTVGLGRIGPYADMADPGASPSQQIRNLAGYITRAD